MGKNVINEVGNKHGKLTVIERAGSNERRAALWLCKCDCGRMTIVPGRDLRSGGTRSCGCIARHRLPPGESGFNFLYRAYRGSAIRKGVAFELTKEQMRKLTKLPCHYCGIEPFAAYPISKRRKQLKLRGTYTYNGLDRIDNNKGYSIENVVPCCKRCNRAKFKMTVDEFRDWLTAAYKHFVEPETHKTGAVQSI